MLLRLKFSTCAAGKFTQLDKLAPVAVAQKLADASYSYPNLALFTQIDSNSYSLLLTYKVVKD